MLLSSTAAMANNPLPVPAPAAHPADDKEVVVKGLHQAGARFASPPIEPLLMDKPKLPDLSGYTQEAMQGGHGERERERETALDHHFLMHQDAPAGRDRQQIVAMAAVPESSMALYSFNICSQPDRKPDDRRQRGNRAFP